MLLLCRGTMLTGVHRGSGDGQRSRRPPAPQAHGPAAPWQVMLAAAQAVRLAKTSRADLTDVALASDAARSSLYRHLSVPQQCASLPAAD